MPRTTILAAAGFTLALVGSSLGYAHGATVEPTIYLAASLSLTGVVIARNRRYVIHASE